MGDDFSSVKADVEALLRTRGYASAFRQDVESFGHVGQTASVHLVLSPPDAGKAKLPHTGEKIGYLARLSPAIERELEFVEPVYVFELALSALETDQKPVYLPASPFPASFRDISMLVSNDKTQDEVMSEIRASAAEQVSIKILESVKLFDVYDGKGIPTGYRSMAFSFCYRAYDRTLNDEEVDKIHNSIRDALTQKGYNMR
jgi:phenylalanyl-tRNA synthetase beta chain